MKGWANTILDTTAPSDVERNVDVTLGVVAEAFAVERSILTSAVDRRGMTTAARTARMFAAHLLHDDGFSFADVARTLGWRTAKSARDAFLALDEILSKNEAGPEATVLRRARSIIQERVNLALPSVTSLTAPTKPDGLRP